MEEVARAGHNMLRAAEQMAKVSNNMQLVFEAHQRFLDDWLIRYQGALEKAAPVADRKGRRNLWKTETAGAWVGFIKAGRNKVGTVFTNREDE